QRAVVYISGLGQYELHINGTKTGDTLLNPGWTDYRKTIFYNAYDVTSQVHRGLNALGVLLGNGMYNVVRTPGRYTKFAGSFGQPKLILQLQLTYADGSTETIGSNASWKTAPGPIVFSSTYGGEDYDARILPSTWDTAGFDDGLWKPALVVQGPGGALVAQMNPAIRIQQVFHPISVKEPKPGILVYDLGQNFSGWPQIRVQGPAGSTVRLIPGELLDADGLVTQRSSGGPQWFSYTLNGRGQEQWHPRFSYYGFRYVQVEGISTPQHPDARKPVILGLEGQFLYSSAPQAGSFATSDALFNRIHALILAAIRSNMQSIFTDCPHREKLGWLEETHLMGSALMDDYDLARLYEKVANDIHDAQYANGAVPEIAPEYVKFTPPFDDSPEWGSAAVLDPWIAYQNYGDRRNLELHYGDMQRYVAYLGTRANGHLLNYGLGDWYDIGPGAPGYSKLTSRTVTATATYYQDILVMTHVAALLGHPKDAARYVELGTQVKNAFNAALWHPESQTYNRNSQTANAMPLVTGLVAPENRQHVLDNLVADIRLHQNHVTAGDVGFHYVVDALLDGGRSDVLYDMLSRTDPPSYGAQLAHGATSLTEAWDFDPDSSQNHLMLGHAEEWFYRGLAGIDLNLTRPRDQWIIIHPNPVGTVTWTRCTEHTVLGDITDNWSRQAGKFILDVTIPANATATVYIPTEAAKVIEESGRPVNHAPGVTLVSSEANVDVYRVASGAYHFVSR
ncbi:MAG TPA: family 78 glycoside hydrolase catalytic domain, partial [Acidobacteriaceae bacterium]|nr:family 78 glycoside hydrolase catalytic domain [Acidobacteriaceae bacterium]